MKLVKQEPRIIFIEWNQIALGKKARSMVGNTTVSSAVIPSSVFNYIDTTNPPTFLLDEKSVSRTFSKGNFRLKTFVSNCMDAITTTLEEHQTDVIIFATADIISTLSVRMQSEEGIVPFDYELCPLYVPGGSMYCVYANNTELTHENIFSLKNCMLERVA